ncbi:hypothetical protein LD85_0444 [Saccharolobus islandicus L.D.8.5]|uniref:Uncharacterized protein n=1 Tax=Saccharolobus islandicus (strain L.D.8.5 / Lassen \|nr:hypothetical protein LD85_0444 [Sulfolobus islandicus L.D.8.5]
MFFSVDLLAGSNGKEGEKGLINFLICNCKFKIRWSLNLR